MNDGTSLSVAFIEKRPLSAARALASADPRDSAALLETIPSRITARALQHMDPWAASPVVSAMTDVSAAAVCRELDYPHAVAVLRLLSSKPRDGILAQLPQKLRREFKVSLSYPDDTVGAHMSTAVIMVDRTETVADAQKLMRRAPAAAGDVIFVVDRSKKLLGAVEAVSLLRHAGTSAAGEIMDEKPASLSARARLRTVADLAAWLRSGCLPVTNRQGKVIGVLSRATLFQALDTRTGASVAPASITVSMAEAFFVSIYGLAQLLADIPSGSRPRTEGRR